MKISRNFRWSLLIVVVLFVISYLGIKMYQSSDDHYATRVYKTKMDKLALKFKIMTFFDEEKRYPETLAELKAHLKSRSDGKNTNEADRKEYISCKEGTSNEYAELNGQGGWYYNNKTGVIKVNLTEPIKKYMKLYSGQDRVEVPSEWQE